MTLEQTRQHRFDDEIMVDAYEDDEVAMDCYYYLEGKMAAPFPAVCLEERHKSTLKTGDWVTVLGLADEDTARSDQMWVRVRHGQNERLASLSQLRCMSTDPATLEAVDDWHHWVMIA